MGKIVKPLVAPPQEMVKDSISSFIQDSTTVYPNFLDSAPVFVNYYSRKALKSTYDESFESYNEIVGSESPNKFLKIENVPLYNLDTADFGSELSSSGWSGDVTSTALILPHTVTPVPDDLIEIEYQTKKFLFQVTDGKIDNYNSNRFYKISFSLSQYTLDEVKRLTDSTSVLDFSLIGKKKNVIVPKNHYNILETIKVKHDQLLIAYKETFFDKYMQSFVCKDLHIIDPLLNMFIGKNELNKPYTEFRNSTVISPSLKKYTTGKEYSNSIYKQLESFNFSSGLSWTLVPNKRGREQYQFMYYHEDKLSFITYVQNSNPENHINLSLLTDIMENSNKDANIQFIQSVFKYIETTKKKVSSKDNKDASLILDYDREEELSVIFSNLEEIEELYQSFPESIFGNLTNAYYLTPLVLYAMKCLFSILSKD